MQPDNELEWEWPLTVNDALIRCRQQLSHHPPLLKRHWRKKENKSEQSMSFKIMQWNMLAQALSLPRGDEYGFTQCPVDALQWKTRRLRILEEMLTYKSDVICMQEVDHYTFLMSILKLFEYEGTFCPKVYSPCLKIEPNDGPDGCAIFYNKQVFELVSVKSRVLEAWGQESNQVCILMILQHRETKEEICIATTHLKSKSDPELEQLRKEQGKDILKFLKREVGNRPVILTGDFNAEPWEAVYRTMTTNSRFHFNSAYLLDEGLEQSYSTWKIRKDGDLKHTIDYIFYTEDSLQVSSILDPPTEKEIGPDRVPSYSYPSDHFSLVAEIQLKSGRNRKRPKRYPD